MLSRLQDTLRTPLRVLITVLVLAYMLALSALPPGDATERVRFYTRSQEFDYVAWTINAFWVKFNQGALGLNRYLDDEANAEVMRDFIDLTYNIQVAESQLRQVYADPAITDKDAASRALTDQLDEHYTRRAFLGPLAESILQTQVVNVLGDLGLAPGGQSIPPALYHMTPAPMALVVSPRDAIRQDANLSIQPEMTLEAQIALEDAVARGLDVSTLMVGIGGIGLYPTMVTQTSDLNWLAEVVAHEWIHNYFTLRPLGASYFATPELRTMNETAASIAGKEIGALVIEKFYPDFAPSAPPRETPKPQPSPGDAPPEESAPPVEPAPPAFDFRTEMRDTRIIVDHLLAGGQVALAEQYMEERRVIFWDNGYRIRKLNQAYFAFYGAYADVPGGAAGVDPVAEAVRDLRAQSPSLRDFLGVMGWMASFEDLVIYLGD